MFVESAAICEWDGFTTAAPARIVDGIDIEHRARMEPARRTRIIPTCGVVRRRIDERADTRGVPRYRRVKGVVALTSRTGALSVAGQRA